MDSLPDFIFEENVDLLYPLLHCDVSEGDYQQGVGEISPFSFSSPCPLSSEEDYQQEGVYYKGETSPLSSEEDRLFHVNTDNDSDSDFFPDSLPTRRRQKPRIRWTPHLTELFNQALTNVKAFMALTPSRVFEEMKRIFGHRLWDGFQTLELQHVKARLRLYRQKGTFLPPCKNVRSGR